jgi:hypothetical protein
MPGHFNNLPGVHNRCFIKMTLAAVVGSLASFCLSLLLIQELVYSPTNSSPNELSGICVPWTMCPRIKRLFLDVLNNAYEFNWRALRSLHRTYKVTSGGLSCSHVFGVGTHCSGIHCPWDVSYTECMIQGISLGDISFEDTSSWHPFCLLLRHCCDGLLVEEYW